LLHYRGQRIPTLRVYGWSRPWLSIGYKQHPRDFLQDDCPFGFVRRITGGAAVLHYKEVTYSIICAYTDLDLPAGVKQGYRVLCSFLKDFYQRCGLRACFAYEVASGGFGSDSHSCFSSWHEFDMIIDGRKIGGNAQRRQREVIFQQGSIPQQIDRFAIQKALRHCHNALPSAASLDDFMGKKTDFFVMQHRLAESFAHCFGVKLQKSFLNEQEQQTTQLLLRQKYSRKRWNRGHAETSLV